MNLVIDFETTGFIKRDFPLDHDMQPHIVQAAAIMLSDDWKEEQVFQAYIRPSGWEISKEAQAVHGISAMRASREGLPEVVAIGVIVNWAANVDKVIGHNVYFERDIVLSILLRRNKNPDIWRRPRLRWECTMRQSTQVCAIDNGREDGGAKWPSLDEACEILLGEKPREGPHDALADARRTCRLYRHLIEMGAIEQ